MAVNLTKGGNVNLSKEAPTMTKAIAGLGWDSRATDGQAFDLDASVFLVGADGKVLSDQHFVFFNNAKARTALSFTRVTTVLVKARVMMNRLKSP